MKKTAIRVFAAILSICGATASCQQAPKPTGSNDATEQGNTKVIVNQDPVQTAINQYLTDSIGSMYAKGDICIPVTEIIDTEKKEGSDTIRVWGDFWVFNYRLAGDTLKTVSGGSHPGMFCLCQRPDSTYEVVGFDAVGDGSNYEPSARRIFGERFDNYQTLASDQQHRDSIRLNVTADYVSSHDIQAQWLHDEGWDPVALSKQK